MKKISQNTIIGWAVGIIVFINFILIPYLYRREATRSVLNVLEAWKSGDLPSTYDDWIDPQKSPPVYGVLKYKITNRKFYKKDGDRFAEISAYLELSNTTVIPDK